MKMLFVSKRQLFLNILPIALLVGLLYTYNHDTSILSGKVIVVDAGHGGIDPGANRPGVLEKDINLAVALQIKEVLNQNGAKVVLSRQADVELSTECDNENIKGRYRRDLAARVELAEESDADLFISIHANAVANTKKRGAEVFYFAKSEASKQLSNSIQSRLQQRIQVAPQVSIADFYVLRRNKIPAVLIEVGYITNLEERKLLQTSEYQKRIAEAVENGVKDYFKQ